jgi:hypothetical protein
MRLILPVVASLLLGSFAAYAQSNTTAKADPHATAASQPAKKTVERPIDNGPNTPQANNAYQGGGVVLQGAPGAPAPTPQPTPPGQTPQNAVPK